jgi:drug/metabolite transporter (DMT)-like permease
VVLQLIPFLYVFGAILKIAIDKGFEKQQYSRLTLTLAGLGGMVTTPIAMAVAFFPAQQIKSVLAYEIWMFGGTALFIGLAAFFFFVYGGRKEAGKFEALESESWETRRGG